MKTISLSHSDNSIAFEFVALHFKGPARNQYAAMLEGHDRSWQMLGAQREASFTDLPPGEYTFKVKAANSDGVWSEPTSLAVIIALPFWKAWWFLAGVPIGLAFIGLAARFNRVRRDREQHRRILANVHDKGGAILSTLKVQTEAARQDLRTNSDTAEKSLDEVTKLIDELALGVRQSTWLQDSSLDSLQDLALHLASFGGKLFDHADIAFSLAPLPDASEQLRLSMRWREELLCIFQEAMNNAARHAKECTNVVLAFTLEGRMLTASLVDDGVGFSKENLTRINGLENMRRRAAFLKGTLSINPVNGRGTRVELTAKLPLWVVVSMRLRTVSFPPKGATVLH
jgi:two-component sensor histidine kinase